MSQGGPQLTVSLDGTFYKPSATSPQLNVFRGIVEPGVVKFTLSAGYWYYSYFYYYPELKQHRARMAGYAESAYQQISADLKHDLPFKVQLILFKTHSEFEQENVFGIASEGVGAL